MEREIYNLQKDIRCESSCVWLKEEESNELYAFIYLGPNSLQLENVRVPVGKGLCGCCVEQKKPLISNDLENDERFFKQADMITKYNSKNVICLPIIIYDECIGCVQLLNKENGFTDDDIKIGWEMVSYLIDNL